MQISSSSYCCCFVVIAALEVDVKVHLLSSFAMHCHVYVYEPSLAFFFVRQLIETPSMAVYIAELLLLGYCCVRVVVFLIRFLLTAFNTICAAFVGLLPLSLPLPSPAITADVFAIDRSLIAFLVCYCCHHRIAVGIIYSAIRCSLLLYLLCTRMMLLLLIFMHLHTRKYALKTK